jgi:aspartyl-tRNA(Asn)/glutamyl-tRNA(Gln) amidotransferase subunit A
LINPKSLSDIQSLISKRELSVLELSNHYLKKIETSKTNSFIEVYHEEILEKAAIIDAKIKNNSAGALAGMIIGLR